ncbi:MAG: hypothetical protein OSJ55_07540 [Bacteroidales bacterium]|nr:hypothetical protein [Bacteroidales bacterium]
MNKEQKKFYTDDFYKKSDKTLDVLNTIVQSCQVGSMDMYSNGEFLYMDVYDDVHTREVLSPVISDFNAYKVYNNYKFIASIDTRIGLCALVDDFEMFFDQKIRWDYDDEQFFITEE